MKQYNSYKVSSETAEKVNEGDAYLVVENPDGDTVVVAVREVLDDATKKHDAKGALWPLTHGLSRDGEKWSARGIELRSHPHDDKDMEVRTEMPSFEGRVLRAQSTDGYGFEIPVEDVAGSLVMEDRERSENPIRAAWDSEADVDDKLGKRGSAETLADEHGFDSHAIVGEPEVVKK